MGLGCYLQSNLQASNDPYFCRGSLTPKGIVTLWGNLCCLMRPYLKNHRKKFCECGPCNRNLFASLVHFKEKLWKKVVELFFFVSYEMVK
jgi:hypothetical protein